MDPLFPALVAWDSVAGAEKLMTFLGVGGSSERILGQGVGGKPDEEGGGS